MTKFWSRIFWTDGNTKVPGESRLLDDLNSSDYRTWMNFSRPGRRFPSRGRDKREIGNHWGPRFKSGQGCEDL